MRPRPPGHLVTSASAQSARLAGQPGRSSPRQTAADGVAQNVQVPGVARGLLDHVHEDPAQVDRPAAELRNRPDVVEEPSRMPPGVSRMSTIAPIVASSVIVGDHTCSINGIKRLQCAWS